jgi:hypothetical protein
MSSREFTQGPYPQHGRCPLRRGSSRARAGGVLRDHAFAPIRAAHHRVRLGPGGQAGQNGVSRSGGDHPHRVATSLDCVLLTEQGIAPPARSIAAAIRACVEAVPVCVGKPGPSMLRWPPGSSVCPQGDPGRRRQPGLGRRRCQAGGGSDGRYWSRGLRPERQDQLQADLVMADLPELSAFLACSWEALASPSASGGTSSAHRGHWS